MSAKKEGKGEEIYATDPIPAPFFIDFIRVWKSNKPTLDTLTVNNSIKQEESTSTSFRKLYRSKKYVFGL